MERVRWHEVTGIFGGTFDPPHLGHQEAVTGLFKYPGLKEALVVPAATPPHKPCQAGAPARLAMARIAFGDLPHVRVDDREIRKGQREPSRPSYSYDTLKVLGAEFGASLAFVVGADQFAALHTWYRFPELLGLSHWIVLARRPDGEAIAGNVLREWEASGLAKGIGSREWRLRGPQARGLLVAPTDALELSSSQIRQAIARDGKVPENTVRADVESYLKLHRIYGMESS